MATHAAGVVIAGDKLAEQFPLYIDHSSNLLFHLRNTICIPQKMQDWLNLITWFKNTYCN